MKRRTAVLCLCLLLILPGCTQIAAEAEPVNPTGPLVDGAFPYTPQELVDRINETAAVDDSGMALQLEDYTESGESISTSNSFTTVRLTLEENNSGMLDDVRLYWSSGFNDLNEQYSVGLYCGTILGMLLPERSETISEGLSNILSAGSGSVEYTFDGVYVSMFSSQGHYYLDVELEE